MRLSRRRSRKPLPCDDRQNQRLPTPIPTSASPNPTAISIRPPFLVAGVDPTGAGDTFAGGFLGYLAGCGDTSDASLARAIIYGSTLASFAVEDFSIDRLLRLTKGEIADRFRHFKRLTHFDEA